MSFGGIFLILTFLSRITRRDPLNLAHAFMLIQLYVDEDRKKTKIIRQSKRTGRNECNPESVIAG